LTFVARFRRSLVLLSALGLAVAYWVVAPFLPTNEQTEWLRVFMIVISGTGILLYIRSFLAIVLRPTPIAAQQSVIGTVLILLGLFLGGIWLLLWRMAGFPEWMIKSDMNGFLLYILGLGALFSVLAVKTGDEGRARTDWRRVAIILGVTLVLGIAVVHIRPDVRPVVEWLRQRVSEMNINDPATSEAAQASGSGQSPAAAVTPF
jgi:hypothetical protein